jgi:predicted small lipoprotein YifL
MGIREGLRVTTCKGTPARIAAIVALTAALGLAGCGRKSGLDAPPGAVAEVRNLDGTPVQQAVPEPYEPDAKPTAAPATGKRRFPILDWLIE